MATTHEPQRIVKTICKLTIEAGADPEFKTVKAWFRRLMNKAFTGYVNADFPGDGSVEFRAVQVEPFEDAVRRLARQRRKGK